jgi:integrase
VHVIPVDGTRIDHHLLAHRDLSQQFPTPVPDFTTHTFGYRLRAAGVSHEDRQYLLGHKSGSITTHYSTAEKRKLIKAANAACGNDSRKSPAVSALPDAESSASA